MSKKQANLIDQKTGLQTGLPLNPFWINATATPSELDALKNSYPKDNGNIIQLLHDTAITTANPWEPWEVEIACCPHDMNGLLKNEATTNAYIWGEYNEDYRGTLYYNDLTNREVGPLDLRIEARSYIEENNDVTITNHNELNIKNNNLFDVIMPWDLYWEGPHSGINFAKVTNAWKLESNPVDFMNIKKINIIEGKTYRIYCRNPQSTQPASMLNEYLTISFQGSLDGHSWDYIYDADGQPFALYYNDFQIADTGYKYKDIVFDKSYEYLRVFQKAGGYEFPSRNNGIINWPTAAGGIYYPYISSIEFLGIGLASKLSVHDATTTSGFVVEGANTKTLSNIDDTILNLNDYLIPSEPLNFIYKTKVSDNLYDYLKNVGTIINQQETLIINKILIKPTTPSIKTITYNSVTLSWYSKFIDLPSNTSVNICISKSSDLVPLYSAKVTPWGGIQEITFIDLEENTSYYLFAAIASTDVENGNDDYIYFNSEVRRFTTPRSIIPCDIKFYSKASTQGTYWVNYPIDNGNILINRYSQLIAWTSALKFYNPLNKNDTGGYFLEVALSPESHWATVTNIKMEGHLEYEYTAGNNITKSAHCLLQSDVEDTKLWRQSAGEGTIYGTSFKYTYGNGGKTVDAAGHDVEYSAKELADKLDILKITIEGRDAEGNALQYTTTYPVYAPKTRARRD